MKLKQRLAILMATAIMVTAIPMTTMGASTNRITKVVTVKKDTRMGYTIKESTTTSGTIDIKEDNAPILVIDLQDDMMENSVFFIRIIGGEFDNVNEYRFLDEQVDSRFNIERISQSELQITTKVDIKHGDRELYIPIYGIAKDDQVFIELLAENTVLTSSKYIVAIAYDTKPSVNIADLKDYVIRENGIIAPIVIEELYVGHISGTDRVINIKMETLEYEFTTTSQIDISLGRGFDSSYENQIQVELDSTNNELQIILPEMDSRARGTVKIENVKVAKKVDAKSAWPTELPIQQETLNVNIYDKSYAVATIKKDTDVPLIPLEPSKPVKPDVPLIPLEPSKPVKPDVPLIPLEPSIPVKPELPPSSGGGGGGAIKPPSAEQTIKKLNDTDKQTIVNNIKENVPYTTVHALLRVEQLKVLTNNLFTDKQLQEMIDNPELLKGLGIDLSSLNTKVVLTPIKDAKFNDVSEEHWANDSIKKAAEIGLVAGMPDGTFEPSSSLQVADTFTFLDRVLLLNGTNEMKLPRSTVEKYITNKEHWAFANVASIASKLTETTLEVVSKTGDAPISRELLSQVLYEVTNGKLPEVNGSIEFKDTKNSAYEEAIDYCVRTGLLNGTGTDKMSPEKALTRAELMTILIRLDEAMK